MRTHGRYTDHISRRLVEDARKDRSLLVNEGYLGNPVDARNYELNMYVDDIYHVLFILVYDSGEAYWETVLFRYAKDLHRFYKGSEYYPYLKVMISQVSKNSRKDTYSNTLMFQGKPEFEVLFAYFK